MMSRKSLLAIGMGFVMVFFGVQTSLGSAASPVTTDVSARQELSLPAWAAEQPTAAAEFGRFQGALAGDREQGLLVAVTSLQSADATVRALAAFVLGETGNADHLLDLEKGMQDPDSRVRTETELARLRIVLRLAAGHNEKMISVLAPSFKSANTEIRLWAAQFLARTDSPAAQRLKDAVLEIEQDPAVLAALHGN